jgi:hypothetical protein
MLILGLAVGPLVGFLLGDFLFRSRTLLAWHRVAVIFLVLLFFVLAPIFKLELKAGLVPGILLGLLLAATPIPGEAGEDGA